MRPLTLALVCASLSLASPASAQLTTAPGTAPGSPPAGSVGGTVNGGLPDKTGSTTEVGQTKPPGEAVGDNLGTRPDLDRKSRELDAKIDKGICSGCK